MNPYPIKTALLSVSDKTGIVELASKLNQNNVKIISTGGTGKKLKEAQIDFIEISQITGNPESFGGRMKTISFQVASGLLYRRDNPGDCQEATELNIESIDLVVCNLYPFEEVSKQDNVGLEDLVENIDIGGPNMIRAASKNFAHVCVLTNPAQYEEFIQEFEATKGHTSLELRKRLALSAFEKTAKYDSAISVKLAETFGSSSSNETLKLEQAKELRYGENPHQSAKFFQIENTSSKTNPSNAPILQGKQMSYNNYLDADAAWKVTSDLSQHCGVETPYVACVVKHLNPCGVSLAKGPIDALELAWEGDNVSAFGSIICTNFPISAEMAEWFQGKFIEILIAPDFTSEAKTLFSKKKNLRLIKLATASAQRTETTYRSVCGGLLVQQEDLKFDEEFLPIDGKGIEHDLTHLKFGQIVCKHLKSNAIALTTKTSEGHYWLTGAGMGQPNRLDSLNLLAKLRHNQKVSSLDQTIMFSDAFFPFRDTIDQAAQVGVKTIIQPGGSIRDEEVIEACKEHQIAMYLTGTRHFRH